MQQCQVNFHLIFAPGFDPNEWCLKNGLLSGGLNPGPFTYLSYLWWQSFNDCQNKFVWYPFPKKSSFIDEMIYKPKKKQIKVKIEKHFCFVKEQSFSIILAALMKIKCFIQVQNELFIAFFIFPQITSVLQKKVGRKKWILIECTVHHNLQLKNLSLRFLNSERSITRNCFCKKMTNIFIFYKMALKSIWSWRRNLLQA
jgi:hypothetical protein